MKSLLAFLAVVLLSTGLQASTARQFGVHGIGPRVGLSINPDQFDFGGHVDLGDLTQQLMLFPNIEIGFGDHLTVVAPTFELDYRFREDWGSWNPYLGGGVGPVFYSVNSGYRNDYSNTELGVYIQGGIAKRMISQRGFLFVEMKLGLANAPDVKFTIGWNFAK